MCEQNLDDRRSVLHKWQHRSSFVIDSVSMHAESVDFSSIHDLCISFIDWTYQIELVLHRQTWLRHAVRPLDQHLLGHSRRSKLDHRSLYETAYTSRTYTHPSIHPSIRRLIKEISEQLATCSKLRLFMYLHSTFDERLPFGYLCRENTGPLRPWSH